MRFFKRIWNGWIGLLSRRESGTAIALFRIALGTTVLASVGRTVVTGLAPAVWLDARDGGWLPLLEQPWLVEAMGGLNPTTMWTLVALNLTLAVAVIAGVGGRVSVFLLSQAFLAISFINDFVQGCDDKLISNALWLLVLAPSTTTLSVDCRLRTGRWTSRELIPAWPRYLVIWQLVLVYCTTGLQKVSITWSAAGDYSALYYILQEPVWRQWDMSWLAHVYPLTQIATAATWYWEVTFPVILLAMHYRRTAARPGKLRAIFNRCRVLEAYLVIGVMMHLGVWFFIGLGPFTWVSLACYFCLRPPQVWERLFRMPTGGLIHVDPTARPSRILAGLLALHVAGVTVAALPSTASAMDADLWATPTVQQEFERWSETLSGWGLDVPPDELEEFLWKSGLAWYEFRETALRPFKPYYKYFGTRQSWPMFTGPDMLPLRVRVEIEQAGEWRTIFTQADPDHAWRARQLDHEHGRTALFCIADEPDGPEYRAFAEWIAVRARQDFPEATRLRVSTERLTLRTPAEARAGEDAKVEVIGEVTIALGDKSRAN